MSRYIQNFLKFRPLLSELVSRDIKIKYRRSGFGCAVDVIKSIAYDDYFICSIFKLI